MPRTIFAEAFLDAVGARIVRIPVAVRVQGDRIAAVLTGAEAVSARRDAEAAGPTEGVDALAPGRVLLPGFIDAHVHLAFVPREDHMGTIRATLEQDNTARRRTILRNAAETLRGGVTTVRDCGDIAYATCAVEWDALASAGTAPRVATSGPPVTTPEGHLHWCGGVVRHPAEIPAVVAERRAAGATWLKVMASGGQMTSSSDPFASQFTNETFEALCREAASAGLRLTAHALNTASIVQCASAGAATIEHGLWRDGHGEADFRPDVADMLARRATAVVWTFGGIARLALGLDGYESLLSGGPPAGTLEQRTEEMRAQFAWPGMHDAGVPLAVASDAGVRGTGFGSFVDVLASAARLTGLDAGRTAALGTIAAATALGLEEDVGSIEAGKRADLVDCEVRDAPGGTRFTVGRVWLGGNLVDRAPARHGSEAGSP